MKFYLECIIAYMDNIACCFFFLCAEDQSLQFANKPQIKIVSYVSAE